MRYVLATSRPWNESMARRLEEKTGHAFHLITRKEELTPKYLEAIAPRYVFFPHWSTLIPEAIHSAHECVIFHKVKPNSPRCAVWRSWTLGPFI